MKIWIDFRSFSFENKDFICEIIREFEKIDLIKNINIYCNFDIELTTTKTHIIKTRINKSIIIEQFLFHKRLLTDKNTFFITFNNTKPIFYNKNVIQISSWLENILYPEFENTKFIKKQLLNFIIKSNYKNAKKVIAYNKKSKIDINEKLNISDWKISIINCFFPKPPENTSQIDIKTKHSILWDYVIFDSWLWWNKNIKRLLESIKEINQKKDLSLVFIWNDISNNIEIRETVLSMWLKEKIIFAWIPQESEIGLYYKWSIWVIIPSIYENFPLNLNRAIYFSTKIACSEIDELVEIFWDKAYYFSPISTTDMVRELNRLIDNKDKNINYDKIIENYNSKNFIKNLFAEI